jgi:hypothetical protein
LGTEEASPDSNGPVRGGTGAGKGKSGNSGDTGTPFDIDPKITAPAPAKKFR